MDNFKTINKLVKIQSYDLDNNDTIINYLIENFKPYSKEILQIKNTDCNKTNLLIGLNTKLENTEAIVLAGHIDTVPADKSAYATDPYSAVRKDNKIYGLGIIDMKCYFASIIDNLNFLTSIPYPIIIAITSDEETNLNGIEQIIKTLKDKKLINIKYTSHYYTIIL